MLPGRLIAYNGVDDLPGYDKRGNIIPQAQNKLHLVFGVCKKLIILSFASHQTLLYDRVQ